MATLSESLRTSLTFKVFFIGFLVLLLLIPMDMVENIVDQRSSLSRLANTEITRVWGDSHTFTGPVLTIPQTGSEDLSSGWVQRLQYQHVAPEILTVKGIFDTQLRYRGIYKVPVYLAKISARGEFILPGSINLDIEDKALIQIPFSKIKSLKKIPEFYWNGVALDLSTIVAESLVDSVVFQATIPLTEFGDGKFEIIYEAAGSTAFTLNPWAKQTSLSIESNWGSPSFQGEYFPTAYDIQDDHFNATWDINNIFVNTKDSATEAIHGALFEGNKDFGVKFIQLNDTYQLVKRSIKYAVLFISLTFVVYFLVEVLGGNKLHTIHYLLIGLANCIFYLLLLSLSEHINFNPAYFLSACSSTLLISLYSKSVFQNKVKAVLVFSVLTSLYIYLFITLQSEGFALVAGSIGLFIIMAILMYLTRNTNWHAVTLPDNSG